MNTKLLISLYCIFTLLTTTTIMARTPDSEIMPPGYEEPNNPPEEDYPVFPPDDEPEEQTVNTYNGGHGHKKVIECQTGETCDITVCDKIVEANKDGIRYAFRPAQDGSAAILSQDNRWGILAFKGLLPVQTSEGCYTLDISS